MSFISQGLFLMKDYVKIIYGDICSVPADAIICEANTELESEEGISDRLFELGGDDIQNECHQFDSLTKGQAVSTCAGKLSAKSIIHCIVKNSGEYIEEDEMMCSIRHALRIACEGGFHTVSLPLIGGGQSGIPIKRAAELILGEVKRHFDGETSIEQIQFVLEDREHAESVEEALRQL